MPGLNLISVSLYSYQNETKAARPQLLRHCARLEAQKRGLPEADLALAQTAQGKPYFAALPSLHFSITHSGLYWQAAFADSPLGLDLQQHGERDYIKIAKRWFQAQETAYVEAHGAQGFFDIWCGKESYLKYTGQGLANQLAAFSVVENGRLLPELGQAYLSRPHFCPHYSLCLCSAYPAEIELIDFSKELF